MNHVITLGQRIKELRKKMHMTQEDLAEVMCVPKSTVSAYENDKVDIKGSVLMELSKHLGTTPNYLLGYGAEEKEKDDADTMAEAALSIFNRVKDDKVKQLLIAQLEAAAKIYA